MYYVLFQQDTFKSYYFPDTPEEPDDSLVVNVKKNNNIKRINDIDMFFEKPKKKKKLGVQSSYVSAARDDGVSYISSKEDDALTATHLIKIDVYDMNKIRNIEPINYWKYSDARVKYYVQSEDDKRYQSTRDVIYNITKTLAGKHNCSKYFIEDKLSP